MNAIGTAFSGLQASMTRLNVSANNIANSNTTGPIPGSATAPATPNGQQVYQALGVQQSPLQDGGVVAQVVPSGKPYIQRYDPGSSYADAQGMIAAPDVDLVSEMIDQLTAKLTYDANLSVVKTIDEMQQSLIRRWA